MYRYNCLNKMKEEALNLFPSNYCESKDLNSEILIVRSMNMLSLDLPKDVLVIGRAGIGVNTIPYKKYAKDGIVVMNTPGGNANGVKELTVMALVMSQRDVLGSIDWVKSLKDNPDIVEIIEREKTKYTGQEIYGKKLGVIGLGAIGGLVANIAIELGMDVLGYDPYISVEHAWGLSKHIQNVSSLDELFSQSDIITIHTPLKEDTKGILSKESFDKMKDGVSIINIARAALVNDDDMLDALNCGKVHRYITDFANPKTVNMPNTIIFPHVGGATDESETKCTKMAVKEIIDFIENGNITNSVNYPDINAGICMSKERITLCHLNVSGMISKFTTVLKENNISKMFNNSLDDIAYTIFDLDSNITDEELEELQNIEGVIKVRKIIGKK